MVKEFKVEFPIMYKLYVMKLDFNVTTKGSAIFYDRQFYSLCQSGNQIFFFPDGFYKIIFKRPSGSRVADSKRNSLTHVRHFSTISNK